MFSHRYRCQGRTLIIRLLVSKAQEVLVFIVSFSGEHNNTSRFRIPQLWPYNSSKGVAISCKGGRIQECINDTVHRNAYNFIALSPLSHQSTGNTIGLGCNREYNIRQTADVNAHISFTFMSRKGSQAFTTANIRDMSQECRA